ncbi:Sushi, nidogen and EGF-like domain-containing protein 1, partial [Trichinella britovi]
LFSSFSPKQTKKKPMISADCCWLLPTIWLVTVLSAADESTEKAADDHVLRSFIITCCENGYPEPDEEIAGAVQEWTIQRIDADRRFNTCKSYTGYYNISLALLPPKESKKTGEFGVRCKCPDGMDNLDRNCRYLPECWNGGYRSFSIDLRCVCPEPWFGALCEKFCANGQLVKDGGYDVCQCRPNFYGEECDHVLCFNHGTPVKGRGCLCRFPFVGMHCETELGHLVEFPAESRVKWYSYLFGTCSSIFLILLTALIAYCLFRRRKTQLNNGHRQQPLTANGHHSASTCPADGGQSAQIARMFWTDIGGRPLVDVCQLPPPPNYEDVIAMARTQQSEAETDGHNQTDNTTVQHQSAVSPPVLLTMSENPNPATNTNNNTNNNNNTQQDNKQAVEPVEKTPPDEPHQHDDQTNSPTS